MRNLIRAVTLLALLGSRVAIAQTTANARARPATAGVTLSLTQDTRLMGDAPVGHRQPPARDVSSENARDLEHVDEESAAVDRRLNICRGC
jgi:RNA 3'-terminal phosphate cyclase